MVVNYDLPEVPEAYVHRIGRTARAGASGQAVSFCAADDKHLLRQIERVTRQTIDSVDRRNDDSLVEASDGQKDRKTRGRSDDKGRRGARGPARPARTNPKRPGARRGAGRPQGQKSDQGGDGVSEAGRYNPAQSKLNDTSGTVAKKGAPARKNKRSARPSPGTVGNDISGVRFLNASQSGEGDGAGSRSSKAKPGGSKAGKPGRSRRSGGGSTQAAGGNKSGAPRKKSRRPRQFTPA